MAMRRLFIALVVLAALATVARPAESGQEAATVTGTVSVATTSKRPPDLANAVVWLKPLGGAAAPPKAAPASRPRIVQQKRRFEPHLLVVPVGTAVDFPNRDPFFHN